MKNLKMNSGYERCLSLDERKSKLMNFRKAPNMNVTNSNYMPICFGSIKNLKISRLFFKIRQNLFYI
jgi:hypothetical protein